MAENRDKFDAMIATIRQTASKPDDVTVGAFAEAVQKIQAELMLIEGQVAKLAGSVGDALGNDAPSEAACPTPSAQSADGEDQTAANKP